MTSPIDPSEVPQAPSFDPHGNLPTVLILTQVGSGPWGVAYDADQARDFIAVNPALRRAVVCRLTPAAELEYVRPVPAKLIEKVIEQ
jgi:hypothetical protein